MTMSEKALDVAKSKLGMHEVGGPNTGPIVEWAMHPWTNAQVGSWAEWCAAFVCSCLLEAGSTTIKQLASTNCNTLYKNCDKAGYAWMYSPTPTQRPIQPGDLVFFGGKLGSLYHVGMVNAVNPMAGTLITIEGNASNAVRYKTYQLKHSSVFGFARVP